MNDWLKDFKPDELFESFLKYLTGPNAPIVFLFLVVCFVTAWLGALKLSSRVAAETASLTKRAIQHARSIPAGEKVYRVITTLLRLLVQVVWVWTVYIAGNALYNLFTIPITSEEGPQWGEVFSPIRWNSITSSFTLLGIGALALFTGRP